MQKSLKKWCLFFLKIILGCAIYAVGFDLFLVPIGTNAGGLTGLIMILVKVTGFGTVGLWNLLFNVPLFLLGWRSIGREFFVGSLVGAVSMSVFIDLFECIPKIATEPLLATIYGGIICGAGLGLVFMSGASSGGSDIIVRLLKKRWRDVPIGKINMVFDALVAVLTGITFRNPVNVLYCGIVVYLCSMIMDAVIYRFEYSKVALIISGKHEEIARRILIKLDRGATYLYGQGAYGGQDTKVILVAVKRHQLADLKALVSEIDPDAFVILQESHQVLGDGFARYHENAL